MEAFNDTNVTNTTFNCLIYDELSDFNVTDVTHWQINPGLEVASSILAAIYIILFVVATIWNLFIVITYLVKYELLKEPGNIFLFNLALADLLIALTVMMFSFVAQAAKEFVFGYTDVVRCNVCNFAGFCVMFFIFISLHMLAALSIDRFILLSRPLRYKQMMKAWKAIIIVIGAWIISLVIALLPIFGFGQYEFNVRYGACIPRFSDPNIITNILNFYYVAFCAIEGLIPITIIALTNVFTYRLVSKFLKRNFKRRQTFRSRAELEAGNVEGKKHHHQQTQLVRVFGALLIANIISWTPVIMVVFAILATGGLKAGEVPDGVYIFGWICYLTNPAVHPVIESFFVKDLRYQVNRAGRTVRRVSTTIVRQLTRQKFDDNDIDRASEAIAAGKPAPERKIKFFKKNSKIKLADTTNSTIVVDMDEMTSCSPTPEPQRRDMVDPKAARRSVTFSQTTEPTIHTDHPIKSSLKNNHSNFEQSPNHEVLEVLEEGEVVEESQIDLEETGRHSSIEPESTAVSNSVETPTEGRDWSQSNGNETVSKDTDGEIGTYV